MACEIRFCGRLPIGDSPQISFRDWRSLLDPLDPLDPFQRSRALGSLPDNLSSREPSETYQGQGPVVDLLDRNVDVRRIRRFERPVLVPARGC